MMSPSPLVTIAVPSYNQGRFLADALSSIFSQDIPVEVFVMDGGSNDESLAVIKQFEPQLAGWRSHRDAGQAAAINEGIARGTAPYVCWLNSDDLFLHQGLARLLAALEKDANLSAVYGRAWNQVGSCREASAVWVEPFSERRLALRCIISQPASLIRRSAWEAVQGLNAELHLAMDYDLWWRLFKTEGPLALIDDFVAVNRVHDDTKTNCKRRQHYHEAMEVVRQHYGRVPLKWWLFQPYAVWYKSFLHWVKT